jgi:hypothetical protein
MTDQQRDELTETCNRRWPGIKPGYWAELLSFVGNQPFHQVRSALDEHFANSRFAPKPADLRSHQAKSSDNDRPQTAVEVFRAEVAAPREWSPIRVICERYRALVRRIQGRYSDDPERAMRIIGFERAGCRGYLVGVGLTADQAERWADLIDASPDIWALAEQES